MPILSASSQIALEHLQSLGLPRTEAECALRDEITAKLECEAFASVEAQHPWIAQGFSAQVLDRHNALRALLARRSI